MSLRSISLCLPLLAGCLLVIAPAARAQSGVSVSAASTSKKIYIFPTGPGTIIDSHSFQNADPVSATVTAASAEESNTIFANSNGSATASAQIGRAQVSVATQEFGGGSSNNQASSQWSKALLITSSTLPFGAPAQITLTAHYTGSFSSFLSPSGFPMNFYSGEMFAGLSSTASLNGGAPVALNYYGASHIPTLANDGALPMDITLTQTLNAQIGQTLLLTSSASLTDSVAGKFKETVTETGALAATFGAVPVDANVMLVRPAATPEPGALLVMGSGLLAGLFLLRRRKV